MIPAQAMPDCSAAVSTRARRMPAHTLIELLDEVRDALMQTYGGEIRAMLREAETTRAPGKPAEDDEPF